MPWITSIVADGPRSGVRQVFTYVRPAERNGGPPAHQHESGVSRVPTPGVQDVEAAEARLCRSRRHRDVARSAPRSDMPSECCAARKIRPASGNRLMSQPQAPGPGQGAGHQGREVPSAAQLRADLPVHGPDPGDRSDPRVVRRSLHAVLPCGRSSRRSSSQARLRGAASRPHVPASRPENHPACPRAAPRVSTSSARAGAPAAVAMSLRPRAAAPPLEAVAPAPGALALWRSGPLALWRAAVGPDASPLHAFEIKSHIFRVTPSRSVPCTPSVSFAAPSAGPAPPS